MIINLKHCKNYKKFVPLLQYFYMKNQKQPVTIFFKKHLTSSTCTVIRQRVWMKL